MSDDELERLKARRLEEMQRNTARRSPEKEAAPPDPRKVLLARLGFRGEEVLRNAESQFPSQTRMIVLQLAALAGSGELPAVIDGGRLLALFRAVGLYIRMDTKINVEQDGRMVSLGEKLRSGQK